jgi:hypothetical protein
MNEIHVAKEDKEHEAASGDQPPGTNWLGLGKHDDGPDAFPTFFHSPLISLGVHDKYIYGLLSVFAPHSRLSLYMLMLRLYISALYVNTISFHFASAIFLRLIKY